MHPSFLPPPSADDRDPVDPLLLADIAAGLARTIDRDARSDAEPRLLLRTAGYAVWQLTWPAGAVWDSDHPSAGVLHVVHGELHEQWTDLLHLDHDRRIARAGDAIAVGRGMATRIENRRCTAAVLVHASSPPGPALRPFHEQLRLVG